MKKEVAQKVIYLAVSSIFSIFLTNLGLFMIKESKLIGITTVLIAFVFLYFSFYSFQIKKSKEDIGDIKKEIEYLKQNTELNWKVLNSITNTELIEKINKILRKNRK